MLNEDEQTLLAKKAGASQLPPGWDVEMNWDEHQLVVAALTDKQLQHYFNRMIDVGRLAIAGGKLGRNILTVGGFLMSADLRIRAEVLLEIVKLESCTHDWLWIANGGHGQVKVFRCRLCQKTREEES